MPKQQPRERKRVENHNRLRYLMKYKILLAALFVLYLILPVQAVVINDQQIDANYDKIRVTVKSDNETDIVVQKLDMDMKYKL